MFTEGRTMLGEPQRRWLIDTLTGSTRRWKLWANETMIMPFRLPGWLARWLHPDAADGPMMRNVYLNLDQWDGYPWERSVLADALRDVDGLVVLTGDLHSFIAGTLRTDDGDAVAPCLMVGSVSSANLIELLVRRTMPSLPLPLGWLLRGANPHLSFVNSSAHGFNVLDITRDRIHCEMRAVWSVRSRRPWTWPVHDVTIAHGQRTPGTP
jgi:alkaline phosphatase D